MNEDTLVVVSGYAGDAEIIEAHLPAHERHQCPIVVFSPEDSKIEKMGKHLCRFGGKRCYIGADAIDRQRIQFKMILEEFPQVQFFLFNDSDSFCLTPEIPGYLYSEPVFYSNLVSDRMWKRPPGYPYPRLALHPPWFSSRKILEKMISVDIDLYVDPQTPVIDHWLLQLSHLSLIRYKEFWEGSISLPSADPHYRRVMREKIRLDGHVMLHSVKTAEARYEMENAYKLFTEA